MTDQTITPVAPFGSITALRAVTAFEHFVQMIHDWNEARRTVAVLRSLSAEQLDDIGLTPGDVEGFADKGH